MDIVQQLIEFIFQALAALVSVILAPLDFLINAMIPEANQAIMNFFELVLTLVQQFNDFIVWFLYVLGISPLTWQIIITTVSSLLIIWITLFPVKMIFSVFRGMKGDA